jgi:hypothetical protein
VQSVPTVRLEHRLEAEHPVDAFRIDESARAHARLPVSVALPLRTLFLSQVDPVPDAGNEIVRAQGRETGEWVRRHFPEDPREPVR